MDGDLTAALSNAGKEGADKNVQYAGPHSLDPVHVDEKELQTGHNDPGWAQRGKQKLANLTNIVYSTY